MIHPSILAEQRRQRDLRVADLVRRAEELKGADASLEWIGFEEDHPFLRLAASMAEKLSEIPHRRGERVYLAQWISRVTFRPYPSKFLTAWRVELSFRDWREAGCGGVEFYVDEDELAKVWCLP